MTRERVESARQGDGAGRDVLFIDIAVPRDVEASVRHVPGVCVFDLDDLKERLDRNRSGRQREVPAVEESAA